MMFFSQRPETIKKDQHFLILASECPTHSVMSLDRPNSTVNAFADSQLTVVSNPASILENMGATSQGLIGSGRIEGPRYAHQSRHFFCSPLRPIFSAG
jgi:hypothetical protein